MCLKKICLGRSDFSKQRLKKALPLFLLLWFALGTLVYGAYLLIGNSMSRAEETLAHHLLDDIIRSLSFSAPPSLHSFSREFTYKMGDSSGFLRILQEKEELLLTTGGRQGAQSFDFSTLSGSSWQQTGAWIFLQGKDGLLLPPMTVVGRTLDSGVKLQMGRESLTSWQLLQQIRNAFLLFWGIGGTVFFLLSLLMVKAAFFPLLTTKKRLEKLAIRGQSELLPEKGDGTELDLLYRQINTLLRHNRQLMQEMQQSLDNVAHDLRTPLARLRSVAEYSLQEEEPEKLREALADCLEESELVLRILQVMMNVAEAESGTMRLELAEKDIRESILRAVQLYQYVAEEKRITIELQLEEELLAAIDETRLTQVWANLIDNAIKYGKKDGRLSIVGRKERRENAGIAISFIDDGIGISPSEQNRIWERLYRGDRSRTEQGLGLGLCYVKAVVEAHGGRVETVSTLHKGTRFEVFLPVKGN